MSEPREFIIMKYHPDEDDYTQDFEYLATPLEEYPEHYKGFFIEDILVIEKSAYDTLIADNAELVEALKEIVAGGIDRAEVAKDALAKHGGGQ